MIVSPSQLGNYKIADTIHRTARLLRFEVLHTSSTAASSIGDGILSRYVDALQDFLAANQTNEQASCQVFEVFGWHPSGRADALSGFRCKGSSGRPGSW